MTNIDKTMNENDEVIEPTEEAVEPEATEEVVEEQVEPTENLDDIKKKLATAEAQKEHWRKKATEKKEESPTGTTPTLADLRAIANVHEDDVERLERFAKAEGVSLKDAVKNPEWKAIEALRAEQRDTAASANVSNVRRGPTKVSDETLVSKASKGDLPEDDDSIARLMAAKAKQGRG